MSIGCMQCKWHTGLSARSSPMFYFLVTLSIASINKVLQSDLIQWLHLLQLDISNAPLSSTTIVHKSWFRDDKFKFVCFQSQNMPTCTFSILNLFLQRSKSPLRLFFHAFELKNCYFNFLFTTTTYSDIQKHERTRSARIRCVIFVISSFYTRNHHLHSYHSHPGGGSACILILPFDK